VTTATDIYGNTSEISAEFFVVTDIDELHENTDNSEIFPNPANQYFILITENTMPGYMEADICDINGKIIKNAFSGKTPAGINQYMVDTHGLSNGIYLIKVTTQNKSCTKKLHIIR